MTDDDGLTWCVVAVPLPAAAAVGARRVELLPHQQAHPVLLLQEHLPVRHRALVRRLLRLVRKRQLTHLIYYKIR
jgi:hypothetical protein